MAYQKIKKVRGDQQFMSSCGYCGLKGQWYIITKHQKNGECSKK